MTRINQAELSGTKSCNKEFSMKWIAMTLTMLALVFVFGAEEAQAQPGAGGGGGCMDATGAPIPCPDDEPTTDDNGEPCDDSDRDRVCDSEEPDDCVGQANEDGDGCELPGDASPRELLIGLITTFEPVLPRDEGHKGWSDLMGLTVEALERLNFVFSPCDGELPVDWIELASRGDVEAMARLDDAIKQCANTGNYNTGDFNSGDFNTGIWLAFRVVDDFFHVYHVRPHGLLPHYHIQKE